MKKKDPKLLIDISQLEQRRGTDKFEFRSDESTPSILWRFFQIKGMKIRIAIPIILLIVLFIL